ncbi:MAG TPA: glycosyltransferase [Solirubrobacterales bacterium]|jgi:glycosyltransferase involved in cell wall biosynthesis|nr:glycosyltransferase [Solirubrobacterales bacterium]
MNAKRVAHVALDFGQPSETFIADAIEATAIDGWEPWLLAGTVTNRGTFAYPPSERVIQSTHMPKSQRIVRRARLYAGMDRTTPRMWPGFDELDPAIVMAHFGYAALHAAPLARRAGVPLVTIFHASDVATFPQFHGPERLLGAAQGRRHKLDLVLPRIDTAIAVSGWVEDELRLLGYEGEIVRIPVGIRLDRFSLRGPDEIPPPSPLRLAFVGRLVERKGVDTLLNAIALVAGIVPDVTLDIVGDGPLRAEMEQLAETLRVNVTFHGSQPPDYVARVLRGSHILAMTSRTMSSGERESSPMVLKEAMAVGVAVVTTDNGGCAEILPPAYRDEVVPENDPPALAARIIAVAGDVNLPSRVTQSRAWTEEQFDVETVGRRTVSIFDWLVSQSHENERIAQPTP